MVTIIDYDTGNIRSVENALHRLGAECTISRLTKQIEQSDRVILPGVGEASTAMEKLNQYGLIETIRSLRQPVLGICLGMQLLCSSSSEGNTRCIGIFDNTVTRFEGVGIRTTHTGWNTLTDLRSPLFNAVDKGAYVYFVHSFAASVNHNTIATTLYGTPFSAALNCRNFYGTQFHPEKSGAVGEQILKNFLEL